MRNEMERSREISDNLFEISRLRSAALEMTFFYFFHKIVKAFTFFVYLHRKTNRNIN